MQNELYIVADAIKALRESRGLTQEQLAEKADISVSHLAKIETHDVVNHYIGFINCANSPSLSMLTMKIREEALEVPEPKPEKKEENVITGITEDRLLELMRQACTEFWADMIIRLKK